MQPADACAVSTNAHIHTHAHTHTRFLIEISAIIKAWLGQSLAITFDSIRKNWKEKLQFALQYVTETGCVPRNIGFKMFYESWKLIEKLI